MALGTTTERELDGTTTEYDDIPVGGDRIERLLRELFTVSWRAITVGPIIQGAAWEIRFTTQPNVTMLDGYLTADTGAWHFHLCVGDTHAGGRGELARLRRERMQVRERQLAEEVEAKTIELLDAQRRSAKIS